MLITSDSKDETRINSFTQLLITQPPTQIPIVCYDSLFWRVTSPLDYETDSACWGLAHFEMLAIFVDNEEQPRDSREKQTRTAQRFASTI